ncbi:HAD family hydrolase [Candidatus Parcubacteria bacterium]|nr:MAG: HAD family hydrolase [Candidatus Parcubacteria bacterium]
MRWHTLSPADLERELKTSFSAGITEAEAALRLESHGHNRLPEEKRASAVLIFLRQFQSPLIYILFIVAGVVFLLGEVTDSVIIFAVLLFNALIGAFQEGKAQRALGALKRFVETTAAVIRDGREIIIRDADVVPGDVVVFEEGAKIPADARIIESRNLFVNESALTGEAEPAYKEQGILYRADLPVAERKNMVFQGTAVTRGNAKAVVVATGKESEIGKISQVIAAIDTDIPLKKKITHLSNAIVAVIGIGGFLLFGAGIAGGRSPVEMFKTVVALAVSVIPEGLPVVLTLILATGVLRMARRNAVVKKLQAVEALGEARVIAVDKTGTLTRNEMVVREVFVADNLFSVGGAGYEPKGELTLEGKVVDPANHPELLLAGKIAAFCANGRAFYSEDIKAWRTAGDPTEVALFVFAEKAGFHKDELEQESPLVAEMPFDYETKYHATIHRVGEKQFLSVAGAPEAIFAASESVFGKEKNVPFSPRKREEFEETFRSMTERGLRVIAFAFRELPIPRGRKAGQRIEVSKLALSGFFGIEDSLRPEVFGAVSRAKAAGIRVVMITGDHKLTAISIAREAGIWKEGDETISGEDLAKLPEEELARKLNAATVFSRVSPEDKMRIIQAYRRRGEIVAMTGDGVNDAPSLVAADLGVAMGNIGTEVAKEAADIVLLDDNFGTIISAVEEGKNIYRTIRKVILYFFSTGAGEVFVIAGALFAGFPIPLAAAQILWLNLVTDSFPVLALAMEPKDGDLFENHSGRTERFLFDKEMIVRVAIMAIAMTGGTLYLFHDAYPHDFARASTVSLTALAVFQWFNAWNCRSESQSVFRGNPLSNMLLVGATILAFLLHLGALHTPFMQDVLRVVPLGFSDWIRVVLVASSVLAVEEIRKLLGRATGKYSRT